MLEILWQTDHATLKILVDAALVLAMVDVTIRLVEYFRNQRSQ